MITIKANLHPDMEAAIRDQAEKAGLPINAYLMPILNAVGAGRLTVGPIWQQKPEVGVAPSNAPLSS